MLKALSKVALGIWVLSAVGICSSVLASSASAFTFNADGSVGVGIADIDRSFQVTFDGNVATKDVTGLASLATFTFLGFTNVADTTQAKFDIALKNTSSGGTLTSRTSALGFNVDPNLSGASVSSGGLFAYASLNDSFPNQFGTIDVCFINNKQNCKGGGGEGNEGGVSTGENSKTFSPTLTFKGNNVTSFALSNFGVRYQSINGTSSDGQSFAGDSGTGTGTFKKPAGTDKIPEPSTVSALLLIGFGILGCGKKRKAVV
ncbi:cistern family PEP-CTERM protein [Microcoleus sp. FACHB-831]|uniref:cistern family PEP-CTERM protein n=1 Tax=Microcoleus sp. FACHB-831 TaxID=2692827 RepID=UPI001689874D|nr:cistern family PEP-CTERM protein [Microcoleus sp. FACHB-831]MBD1922985.1 cistern family PEP-CTERM protein [Microcoleus sp. FACHB-831]